MMNRFAYQQNAVGACGEMSVSNGVVCPKPRRLGILNPSCFDDQIRPCRANNNRHVAETRDSRAGAEFLDMILTKAEMPGTPPFFWGSPPSRASNPVIQDMQFGNDKPIIVPESSSSSPSSSSSSSSSSSARKQQGGCVRSKFGNSPAAVRIEGFNCRGNCSISAVA